MKNFFRRIRWKEILCFVLLAAIGIGAIVGIASALTTKEKQVSSFAFARGAIDENGEYVESDRSIYTEDLIECHGLRIEPDFEATGTYQVFYYSDAKVFVGASELFDCASDGIYKKGDSYSFAKYCRVVYTPEVPKDDDGYIDEDFKIRFYNLFSYADQINIYVNKNQTYDRVGLFLEKEENVDKSILYDSVSKTYQLVDNPGFSTTDYIDVSGMNQLKLVYSIGGDGVYTYIFLDSDGGVITCDNALGESNFTILNVPAGSAHLICTYKTGSEFGIYKLG